MEFTKTIPLAKPLGEHLDITLREPVADEVVQMEADAARFGDVLAFKNLLSKISQIEISALSQMGARDYMACQKFFTGLIEVSSDEALEGDETERVLASPIPGLTELKLREPILSQIARFATETTKLGSSAAMRNLIALQNKLEPRIVGQVGIHDFKVSERYLLSFFD